MWTLSGVVPHHLQTVQGTGQAIICTDEEYVMKKLPPLPSPSLPLKLHLTRIAVLPHVAVQIVHRQQCVHVVGRLSDEGLGSEYIQG